MKAKINLFVGLFAVACAALPPFNFTAGLCLATGLFNLLIWVVINQKE